MNEHQERAYAVARQVWDSTEDADAFMKTPHLMLCSKSPIDVAATEVGAKEVEDLLWRIYWGLPR